jgi:hypothetical protein
MFTLCLKNNIKHSTLFDVIFSPILSQTHTITGVVSDDINKPLESANVIAKPLSEKSKSKICHGRCKGVIDGLDKEVKY